MQSLARLGVTFNSDGTLAFDRSTLDAAFAANPSAVEQFFTTKTSGFSDQLSNLITQLAGKTNSLISGQVQAIAANRHAEPAAHHRNAGAPDQRGEPACTPSSTRWRPPSQNSRTILSVVQNISYIGADGSSTNTSSNTSSTTPNLLTSGLGSMGGSSSG